MTAGILYAGAKGSISFVFRILSFPFLGHLNFNCEKGLKFPLRCSCDNFCIHSLTCYQNNNAESLKERRLRVEKSLSLWPDLFDFHTFSVILRVSRYWIIHTDGIFSMLLHFIMPCFLFSWVCLNKQQEQEGSTHLRIALSLCLSVLPGCKGSQTKKEKS